LTHKFWEKINNYKNKWYEIFVELIESASGMKVIKYQPAGRKEKKAP
jgi:hypothetical protein